MTLHERQLSVADQALQEIGFGFGSGDVHRTDAVILVEKIEIARRALDDMRKLANDAADKDENKLKLGFCPILIPLEDNRETVVLTRFAK